MIHSIYNNNKVIRGDTLLTGAVHHLDMALATFSENVENRLRSALRMDSTSGDTAAPNGTSGAGTS